MACSKYEYVKKFETHCQVLPQTYMLVRIDGKGFTKFCQKHKLKKPNDLRCINLMNQAALFVTNMFKDIFLAYGQSDEYSFAFRRDSELFNRRAQKIVTCVVSAFSSSFVAKWSECFPDYPMKQIPVFDARLVCYPNLQVLEDYFRWRQADCHINNLYNTVFWCLVKSGKTNTEVENFLKDTNSAVKNEILFSQFGINYNTIEEVYRKGSIISYFKSEKQKQPKKPKRQIPDRQDQSQPTQQTIVTEQKQHEQLSEATQSIKKQVPPEHFRIKAPKTKYVLEIRHVDLIKQDFWQTIKLD